MKIVLLSDTHNKLSALIDKIPEGDLLLHAGDISYLGSEEEIKLFSRSIDKISHRFTKGIVMCAGNHDFLFQTNRTLACSLLPESVTYLCDQETIIDGVKIYGSPWQPEFFDWAFNLPRGPALEKVWAKIPEDVDILITHGPVYGILDKCPDGHHAGCVDLLNRVRILQPALFVHGHIHDPGGNYELLGDTVIVNASICDERYRPVNRIRVVDFDEINKKVRHLDSEWLT